MAIMKREELPNPARRQLGAMCGRIAAGMALAAVLLSGMDGTARAQSSLADIEAAAKNEGPMTWYVSFYGASIAEQAAAAFAKKYPGLKVNVVRATTGGIFQRLNQDLRAKNTAASVVTMSGVGDYYGILLRDKQLMEYTPQGAGQIIDVAKPTIVPGYVYPMGGGIMSIAYNTKLVTPEQAPKSWADIANGKWDNKLVMGHPSFSGFDAALVVWLAQEKGWDFFKDVKKEDPLIQRSTFDAITSITSGERTVGFIPDGMVAESAQKGNPITIVYPTDGSLFIMGFTSIMKDAPQPNTAKLFTEFLLSKEHAQIVIDNYYHSVIQGVSRDLAGGKKLSDIKLVPLLPSADYEAKLKKSTDEWLDIFGG
jgi:iron(III) transport system substrate-binding protein